MHGALCEQHKDIGSCVLHRRLRYRWQFGISGVILSLFIPRVVPCLAVDDARYKRARCDC